MKKIMAVLLLCALLALAGAPSVLADSAPLAPLGPHLQPMQSTTVRLESERIEIDVHRHHESPTYFGWSAMADYRIQFHFVPTADEEMTAGFPLFVIDEQTHLMGAPVQNMRIVAGGKEIPTERKSVWFANMDTSWAVFPLTFQAGKPLDLEVSYSLPVTPFGKTTSSDLWIAYVLRTGAFWAGTIGRAEAVLTMDKPIRQEDLRTEQAWRPITPGWRLGNGALRWEWQDVEPDFDLSVTVANVYWLDTAADIKAMLAAGVSDRDTLLRIGQALQVLFYGDGRFGMWMQLRDGVSSEKAGEELIADVLGLFQQAIAKAPKDWELRQEYLRLLYYSSWHDAMGESSLLSDERLGLWLTELQRYQADGGPQLPWGSAWPWMTPAVQAPLSEKTQEAVVAVVTAEMPPAGFSTEGQAKAWVSERTRSALSPARAEALVAVALKRVVPAEPAAPAAPEAPAAPVVAPVEPAVPEPVVAPEAAEGAAQRPAWVYTLVAGASVTLLIGLLVMLRRRMMPR